MFTVTYIVTAVFAWLLQIGVSESIFYLKPNTINYIQQVHKTRI